MIVVLCLYHSNRVIWVQVQQIIGALGLFTENQIALDVDFAIGQARFHGDLFNVPLGGNRWGDVSKLDIFFRHLAFVQDLAHNVPPFCHFVRLLKYIICHPSENDNACSGKNSRLRRQNSSRRREMRIISRGW